MYVGTKDPAPGGGVLARNGLNNGRLYVFRSAGPDAGQPADLHRRHPDRRVGGDPSAETSPTPSWRREATPHGAMTSSSRGRRVQPEQPQRVLRHDGVLERRDDGLNEWRLYSLRVHPGNPLEEARPTFVYNADSVVAAGGDIAISPDNINASSRAPDDQRGWDHRESAGDGREGPGRFDLAVRPLKGPVGESALTFPRRPGTPSSTHPAATAFRSAPGPGRRVASSTPPAVPTATPGCPTSRPTRPPRHRVGRP